MSEIRTTAKVKVSVVVPVYNPGDHIRYCIDTLRGQTLHEIEMIFVDDRGTDGSMDLVRKAAKEDNRIRILTNEDNSGAGFSRNRGIEEAQGEYISFVDADDYVGKDFLKLLYDRTIPSKPDIVKGECLPVDENGKVDKNAGGAPLNAHIRRGLERGRKLYTLFTFNHWTAIFKTSMLRESGARYGLTRNSQDTTFLLRTCYYAKTIELEDRAIYYYVAAPQSRMRDCSKERLDEEYQAFVDQMEFILAHCEQSNELYIYLCAKIEYLLRVQAWAHQSHRAKEASEKFLAAMRDYACSLPFAEKLGETAAVIYALQKYGANLATWPYRTQGQALRVEDRLEVVERWTNFMCEHPECFSDKRFVNKLRDVYKMLLSDSGLKASKIKRTERKAVYSETRKQAKRLPEVHLLTDRDCALSIFVKTGVNVYQVKRFLKESALHVLYPGLR